MSDKPISRTETVESVPLLPCPFCGGEAQAMHMDLDHIEEDWKVWGVWCVDDLNAEDYRSHGHYIDNYATEAEAIEAWNTRAQTVFGMTLDEVRQMMKRDAERERACDEKSYDAGFDNGMKAVLQQLDGLIHEGADIDEIQGWIDLQWEEER